MITKISLFTLWFLTWLFLSWPPDTKDIILGILVALFVHYMTADIIISKPAQEARGGGLLDVFKRLFWFLLYVLVFVWECVKANIDVAYRVLHPDLPIRPGTVKVKVGLKSDIGLTFLANSITLTPGTTSVDVDKERGHLYVHCLYVKGVGEKLPVVEKFDRILKRIFE